MNLANQREEIGLEKCVLTLYSILNLMMFLFAERLKWGNYVSLLYLLGIFIIWFIQLNTYFDHRVRGFIYVIFMELSVVMSMTFGMPFTQILLLLIGISVFTGMYGEKNLIVLAGIFSLFLFTLEGMTNGVLYQKDERMQNQYVEELVILLLLHYALYVWVKKREKIKIGFEETIRDLHEAEQSKTDFLCNVSHELRTPINSICGISEIAQKEEDLDRIKEEITQMNLAGKRLLSVVSDVLDYSELQSGKVGLEEEEYYLSATIQNIIRMSYSLKDEKKIEILFHIDGNLPNVLYGDEKKLRRVVVNLISNAIKFTNSGYVLIKVSGRKESYGMNLCFEIKDTGIGMKQSDQEKLFSSFTQIDGSRKRSVGGVGLGLLISQMLVRKMGGILSIRSKEGKGTSVQVVLPQKIIDDSPIAVVNEKETTNVAVYMDLEQFELEQIRDAYTELITDCVGGLDIKYHFFKNFEELNRRLETGRFTHLYLSMRSYQGNQPYFDVISSKIKIIVVGEPSPVRVLKNERLIEISKPVNILSLVEALNEERDQLDSLKEEDIQTFRAPDAKALVVDDNMMNLLVAKRLLESYEIQVMTALSGRDALEVLEKNDFDLIFLDYMMPEMDGLETLKCIREMDGNYNSNVPVIALTANAVAGSREMFIASGFTDFIEKPIDVFTLERKCRKYITQRKVKTGSSLHLGKKEALEDNNQKAGFLPMETDDKIYKSIENSMKLLEEKITNLSTADGMLYCRDEDIYKEMLMQCALTGRNHIVEIEAYYAQADWKNYTIKVHALKSATKTIGALRISEACKELEMLGKRFGAEETLEIEKQEIIDTIREKHPKMISLYQKLADELCAYYEVTPVSALKEKKFFEKTEQMQGIEQRLEDAAYDFDGDQMNEILDEIVDGEIQESLQSIRDKISKSDFISAAEAFSKLFKDER